MMSCLARFTASQLGEKGYLHMGQLNFGMSEPKQYQGATCGNNLGQCVKSLSRVKRVCVREQPSAGFYSLKEMWEPRQSEEGI